MPDLLRLSADIIDSGRTDVPVNRVSQELSEIAPGIAMVESFSHVVAFATDGGLAVFDASSPLTAPAALQALRAWSGGRVHTLVYTHGHLDHVGGSPAFVADAAGRGFERPRVVGHEAVLARFERYRMTSGWNQAINHRQFGWLAGRGAGAAAGGGPGAFLPDDVAVPDHTYADHDVVDADGLELHLHHARGETDDHTWTWIPEHRAITSGDFLIWNFPNAGNPQKVQRYPLDWAAALRAMVAKEPELLLPAHGLPIAGRERIATVLTTVAGALEHLVDETVAMMNGGATLDEVVHTVAAPPDTLALPYLRPLYDEPEFVVRNVWRLYGGWWDGNPARLKPAPDADLAAEVAVLAGGTATLAGRARQLADAGRLDLACQLVEWAFQAAPDDPATRAAMTDVYQARHTAESSLMAKGIFASAARRQA
jgi:alkyl sulfatase BDS1-like metallo-beta-lactamase superfamily hydrolase